LDEWLQANAQRVANVVRVVRPVMLHAASDFLNALTALVVGREFGIPVVYESRGFWEETWLSRQAQAFGWDLARLEARHGLPDVYRWRREIEDRCRRDAQHVVTLAEGMADRIEAGGVPRDRITVVPNGVDVDAFPVLTRNGGLAARLGIGEDTTVVGYISSLVEYEGIETLLAAYKQVEAAASAPVALLIVGDGLERERLERQAAALGLRQAIFTGRVPHDAVLDYYSLIDLFVVPRKPVEVCHLVTPLKPFEAFATGRTVVLSNVRALARIAEQSQAAELFEAGSAQSLAEVLDKLLADPQRCRNLAEAGAQWVRAERTWTANAGIYVRLYESMGVHTTEANLLAETVGIDELRRSLPQEKLFEPESGSPPESADGDLAFRSRPFVCGAIGRWDPTVAERLRGAAPKPLRPIFASESALLCATSGLDEWTDGARRGFYWSPVASGPAPASWQSAAERRLAAGLVVDADEAVLHTCGLGLQELYVREMGDALYFAGRIDPLTELDDAPLHADMAAWASVLGLGCPVGEATGFVEVRRVLGATAWQARAGRLNRLSFEPAWLAVEPVDSAGPDEVVDLVADQIPSDIERLALPLSGGWDSRLLAALAARRSRTTPHAWTCSTDDGKEFDLTMAGPVADALGLEHHLVVAGPDAWLDNREAARARMQYQTWYHTWLMPLARVLWRQRDAVLDGLAGDLLIGGHDLPSAEMRTPASSMDLRLAFMAQLSGGRLRDNDMLAPATSEWAEDGVRAGFLQCTDRFDGHPSALSLCHLVIRTARAIAPAPTWLLGPETRVHLPFVHPDVIAAALRVAEERKVDGAFYRRVLEAGCGPRVAILPSTHDPRRRSAPFFRRQNSPAALASMAKSIGADEEVRALLSPQLLAALADPEALTPIVRDPIRRVTLQWADMLAHWRRRYANRVVW
jgi:glycosyltransferase involved in cell wall biosynthesis